MIAAPALGISRAPPCLARPSSSRRLPRQLVRSTTFLGIAYHYFLWVSRGAQIASKIAQSHQPSRQRAEIHFYYLETVPYSTHFHDNNEGETNVKPRHE